MSFATIDNVHQRIKRKLDDYGGPDDDDDDFSSDLIAVRMRKDDIKAAVNSSIPIITPSPSPPSEPQTPSPPPQPHFQQQKQQQSRPHTRAASVFSYVTGLQFFVRMISGYKTLVVHSNPEDTVKSVHEKIYSITGIPVNEQRLIYRGKQLQWGQTLAECSVQNDASLQLVGRMLSTEHPLAWHIMDEIVLLVCRMCKGEARNGLKHVKDRITEFFKSAPKMDTEVAAGHIQVFSSSCAPAALVMLYLSPHKFNKGFGEELIRHFISSSREQLDKAALSQCAPILLEFCKLLRRVAHDDPLYSLCRSSLGSTVEYVGIERGLRDYDRNYKGGITVQEIFPFVRELAVGLSEGLVSSMECVTSSGLLVSNVRDFVAFLTVLRAAVAEVEDFSGPISVPFEDYYRRYREEVPFLHGIFIDFMVKMETCLGKMERGLVVKERREGGWDQYLDILKELHSISKLYEGAEKEFWTKMSQKKVSFCYLIVRYAKRDEDHRWILEHKDVINFESRRHLAMMWLPEVRDEYEDLHEMLIDRSQLLAESYEYIARAEPITLRAGLFMEFKNEEATGPGVLREWFFLVCQAIFNPQNALFVACPNDRRRFYPNPASTVDPLHLEYFKFSGRIIALALMHKIQVGIVFDRIFFLQLAGDNVSLEDVRDADPYLYSSCKQILSMDPCTVDQDALGLTFVREVEELGARKTVELCPDGRSIIVNSQNRKKYVDLLIEHRFVTSIADQVQKFSEGFADIIQGIPAASEIRKLFFRSLELEDLDWMLHGSESPISVEDWKAHTEYNGYKDTDPQIAWFWKVLDEMTPEQRKVLLFFWTSIKYLPVEGFRGLASRLYIYKSPEPLDRLPSSHTCFYRLCFPPYPSKSAMRKRLSIITQEHVGCSFGTW